MPASDAKFVLRDAESAARVRAAIDEGRIPPLSAIFQDSVTRKLDDSMKRGQTIVQMSFLITNRAHDVVPIMRARHDEASTSTGHTMLTGASLLVSWSPIENRNKIHHPQCHGDIEFYYRQEVEDAPHAGAPNLNFLGLIETHIASKDATYLLYVWEVIYDVEGGERPVQPAFRKDRHDTPGPLQSVTPELLESLGERRADLLVLRAMAERYSLPFVWPPNVELAHARMVAAPAVDPGRMAEVIHEPLPHVFISKTKANADFVERLCRQMERRGIRYWMDDRDLRPGNHWYAQAEQVIHYAPVFLCVTDSKVATGGMRREIDQALRLHEQRHTMGADLPWIIPIVVGDEGVQKRDQLPDGLQGYLPFHAPRIASGYREDDIAAIVEAVRDHLLRQRYL